jgi:hypothetical protein
VTLPAWAGDSPTPLAALLFGEGPSRVVVSTPKESADEVLRRAREAGVPARRLGQTTGGGRGASLRLAIEGGARIEIGALALQAARESCLASIVGA